MTRRRAGYATAGAATGWLLALVLAWRRPIYPAYASLAHRPGGLSAFGDQELAAGIMIGLGAIPFSIAVFVLIYQWLDEGGGRGRVDGCPRPLRPARRGDRQAATRRRSCAT